MDKLLLENRGFADKPSFSRPRGGSLKSVGREVGLALSLLFLANTSYAIDYPLNALPVISGTSGWEASLDGVNWKPAKGSYPNPIALPGVDFYNPESENSPLPAYTHKPLPTALMWYDGAGNADGRSGSNSVYFRYTLPYILETSMLSTYGRDSPTLALAWVAADDWMHLTVNGHSVGTYTLDEHKLPNNLPIPIPMDFTGFLNTHGSAYEMRALGDGTGINTFVIEAHDGGAIPYNRDYEWVFFDAQLANPHDVASFTEIPPKPPEPARAHVTLQPVSASTNMGEERVFPASQVIDQSELYPNYTRNVSDFDSYIASNPVAHHGYGRGAWLSGGAAHGNFDLDLGGNYIVSAMALWNWAHYSSAIQDFNILLDDNPSFSHPEKFSGFTASNSLGPENLEESFAQVFAFHPTVAHYVRLEILNTHGSAAGFYEVMFDVSPIPEPETYAMLLAGLGLIGLFMKDSNFMKGHRRRRREMS